MPKRNIMGVATSRSAMICAVLTCASGSSPSLAAAAATPKTGPIPTRALNASWTAQAQADYERRDCAAAEDHARRALDENPSDASADAIKADCIFFEISSHAQAPVSERAQLVKYYSKRLPEFREALAGIVRFSQQPVERILARCKLDVWSNQLNSALGDCTEARRATGNTALAWDASYHLALTYQLKDYWRQSAAEYTTAMRWARASGDPRKEYVSAASLKHVMSVLTYPGGGVSHSSPDGLSEDQKRSLDYVMRQNEEYHDNR